MQPLLSRFSDDPRSGLIHIFLARGLFLHGTRVLRHASSRGAHTSGIFAHVGCRFPLRLVFAVYGLFLHAESMTQTDYQSERA